MKVITLGKTIIVYESLTNNQIKELKEALTQMLKWYDEYDAKDTIKTPIPIKLKQSNQYLSIVYKNGSTITSTNNSNHKYNYSPIINGDSLYESLNIIKNCKEDLKQYIETSLKYPEMEWMNLPYNKAYEDYLLSPNINPENFVKSLTTGNLPETYKNFLSNVGIALESIKKENQIIINNEIIEIER